MSLRKLAAQLGVARSAPYRHFPSRDDLLEAIVEAAVDEIRQGFQRCLEMGGIASVRAAAGFRWYLDFAKQRPEFYRIIFSQDFNWRIDIEAEARSRSSFGVFSSLVAGVSGIDDEAALHDRSVAIWSILHGFAMLRLNAVANKDGFIGSAEHTVLDLALRLASQPASSRQPCLDGSASSGRG